MVVFDNLLSLLYDVFYTFVFKVFSSFLFSDLGIGWVRSLVPVGMSLLVAQVRVVVVDWYKLWVGSLMSVRSRS